MQWWTGRLGEAGRLEGGDIRVTYDLGPASAPLPEVDSKGRTLLEAFTAIPFDAYLALDLGAGAIARARIDYPELAEFVDGFGPIGADWGSEIEIAPLPPQLRPHRDTSDTGQTPRSMRSLRGPEEYWVVRLDRLGPDRTGYGSLERRFRLPNEDPSTRAELDDSIPSDRMGRLADERRTLEHLIDLSEAIARRDSRSARAGLEAVPGLADLQIPLGSPWDPSVWAAARRGPLPFANDWHPMRDGQSADWIAFARLWVARAIDQRLNLTRFAVEVDREGQFQGVIRPASLIETIYGQLLSQLTRRPDFGYGRCARCGGRVTRSRRPGPKENRWHPGCKENGRKREQRQRARPEITRDSGGHRSRIHPQSGCA